MYSRSVVAGHTAWRGTHLRPLLSRGSRATWIGSLGPGRPQPPPPPAAGAPPPHRGGAGGPPAGASPGAPRRSAGAAPGQHLWTRRSRRDAFARAAAGAARARAGEDVFWLGRARRATGFSGRASRGLERPCRQVAQASARRLSPLSCRLPPASAEGWLAHSTCLWMFRPGLAALGRGVSAASTSPTCQGAREVGASVCLRRVWGAALGKFGVPLTVDPHFVPNSSRLLAACAPMRKESVAACAFFTARSASWTRAVAAC